MPNITDIKAELVQLCQKVTGPDFFSFAAQCSYFMHFMWIHFPSSDHLCESISVIYSWLWFYLQKLGILDENERIEDQTLFDSIFKNSEFTFVDV